MIKEFIKTIIRKINATFRINLYAPINWIKRKRPKQYYHAPIEIGPYSKQIRQKAKVLDPGDGSLKLHLGCGTRHFKGYVNIDLNKTDAVDLACNICSLPFPENPAQLIETYHVIEHMPRHDLPIALKEWLRVLDQGGKLIVEYPDFDKTVREYVAGNEQRIDNIFGLQRFEYIADNEKKNDNISGLQRFPADAHLFGYNFKRLEKILKECGYENIISTEATDYHKFEEPCLRIEANKPKETQQHDQE